MKFEFGFSPMVFDRIMPLERKRNVHGYITYSAIKQMLNYKFGNENFGHIRSVAAHLFQKNK